MDISQIAMKELSSLKHAFILIFHKDIISIELLYFLLCHHPCLCTKWVEMAYAKQDITCE